MPFGIFATGFASSGFLATFDVAGFVGFYKVFSVFFV
jgi:hypothetical protein